MGVEAAQREQVEREPDEPDGEAGQRRGQARTAAMGALRQVAGEAATAVVTRLTGHAPAADAVDRAVGGLLAARGQG